MNNYDLSNPEIVTIALKNLGGSVSRIDLEDIAIEAFKLAPKRFCWKKYNDRIDLRIVLYSVNDAIKTDIGYISGNSKYGYLLTSKGKDWILSLGEQIIETFSSRKQSTTDIYEKEKARLLRSTAYKKFLSGEKEKISIIDYREFTRTNDYFPDHIKEQRFTLIKNIADDNRDLQNLWEYLQKTF